MKPRLSTPHSAPQVCTDISDRPYGSISAMKMPPRKLLKVVKKISPNRPGMPATIRMVPRTSSFLGFSWLCAISGSGTFTKARWISAAMVMSALATTMAKMPR